MTVVEIAEHAAAPILVETFRPGDEVLVSGELRVVSAVEEYEDGTVVVYYFKRGDTSYENKASAPRGASRTNFLVEKMLIAKRKGGTWVGRRGKPETAVELHAEKAAGEIRRWAARERRS